MKILSGVAVPCGSFINDYKKKLFSTIPNASLIFQVLNITQIKFNSASTLGKSTLIDLTEHNANHIIPSYCYLPVSCRSLVDRCGSPGSCKPQI